MFLNAPMSVRLLWCLFLLTLGSLLTLFYAFIVDFEQVNTHSIYSDFFVYVCVFY